jgi:hypothetical protein
MRSFPATLLLLGAITVPACALSIDDKTPPDQQSIDALEARAAQAQPKEQCFLYAQIVHQMIEFSALQYASGEVEKATSLLKQAQQFSHKIQSAVTMDDKKLKDAQILLRHTAFRLSEMLHSSSTEDRPLMAETLSQLNAAQNETMLAVFKK